MGEHRSMLMAECLLDDHKALVQAWLRQHGPVDVAYCWEYRTSSGDLTYNINPGKVILEKNGEPFLGLTDPMVVGPVDMLRQIARQGARVLPVECSTGEKENHWTWILKHIADTCRWCRGQWWERDFRAELVQYLRVHGPVEGVCRRLPGWAGDASWMQETAPVGSLRVIRVRLNDEGLPVFDEPTTHPAALAMPLWLPEPGDLWADSGRTLTEAACKTLMEHLEGLPCRYPHVCWCRK